MAFNTYKEVENLKNSGASQELAVAIVELHTRSNENTATKNDVIRFESKIETMATRTDIAALKSELKADIHTEFSCFRSEMKADIKEMLEQMATKKDLSDIKVDMLKWMIPFFFTIILAIVAMGVPLWSNKDQAFAKPPEIIKTIDKAKK